MKHYAEKNTVHAAVRGFSLRPLHTLRNIIASVPLPNAMTAPLSLVSLPLFPLHTVLFPGGWLPLRVFEPRYRTMVRCCREQGAPFGVVTLLSGDEVQRPNGERESFYTVGTIASIETVEPLSSGLELIQCQGKDRFRIQQTRKLTGGLWVADVELLPSDQKTAIPDDLRHAAKALQQVLHKLPQRHAEHAGPAEFADCGWVANRWCELFPMEERLQLQLMQMDSPLLRLELVTDALERAGIVLRPHMQT